MLLKNHKISYIIKSIQNNFGGNRNKQQGVVVIQIAQRATKEPLDIILMDIVSAVIEI